jgi:hypothetical protein
MYQLAMFSSLSPLRSVPRSLVRELLGFATPTNTTPSTTTRHSKIESTVRYLGIKVDDAIEIAKNIHLISDAIANQRTWSAAVSEVADRG